MPLTDVNPNVDAPAAFTKRLNTAQDEVQRVNDLVLAKRLQKQEDRAAERERKGEEDADRAHARELWLRAVCALGARRRGGRVAAARRSLRLRGARPFVTRRLAALRRAPREGDQGWSERVAV